MVELEKQLLQLGLVNWEKRSETERYEILSEYIEEDTWIIDGNFTRCEKERFKRSDIIIFLDYSLFAQFRGVTKRMIMNLNKEVIGIPGCKEKINFSFLKFIRKFNKTKRRMYLELLKKEKDDKVVILKNRKSLNKYLETLNIEVNYERNK